MQARVFAPLGMHDTSFFVSPEDRNRVPSRYWHEGGGLTVREPSGLLDPDRRFPAPAFGMFSTAADMGALMRMMLNGGTHEGRRILSERAVAAMTTNQVRADSRPVRGLGWTVGGGGTPDLNFSTATETTFGHGGSSGAVAWADSRWDLAGVLLIHQADQDARHARTVFTELAFAAITPGWRDRPKGR